MDNFQKDLKTGGRAEEFIISQFEKQHKGLRQGFGNIKGYDLIADDGYTAEVKYDRLSAKTQKIGFEYECYGKESGIAKTKAVEWIHIFKLYDQWVYCAIPTPSLKSFLKSNWEFLQKAQGGDNNASKMVIVSVYDFADAFSYFPMK